jgi:hypothetical protein
MLVLRPYSLPINPNWKRISEVLGARGLLLGKEQWEGDDGRKITLKRWVQEAPMSEAVKTLGEFAILRAFIQYINEDPTSDFTESTGKTNVQWTVHRLSRIVTLWIPLSSNKKIRFLLSVGNIDEGDVKRLMMKLIPEAQETQIAGQEFEFPKVRDNNPRGWMHGCENRPGTIQRGTLYGDFDFTTKTELNGFFDSPAGTTSNQEGIILDGNRKVRVLKLGKFQLMGIPKGAFFDDVKRSDVMKECFDVASLLLRTAGKAVGP